MLSDNMEYIFCKEKKCLIIKNYSFLHDIQINQSRSSIVDPIKICFELCIKYTKKHNGTELGHNKYTPSSLCAMGMIQLICPNKSVGFDIQTERWSSNSMHVNYKMMKCFSSTWKYISKRKMSLFNKYPIYLHLALVWLGDGNNFEIIRQMFHQH